MLGWRRVSPASLGRLPDGAGGHRGRMHAGEGGVQGGIAAHFHLVARAALAEGPGLAEPRGSHEPVDDGPDHRPAALQALPDEALGGDPPGGDLPDRRFDGRRGETGVARRAGRPPAMTFPFHCMQTGIRSEATQGNTSRCRVPLDVGDTAMIAALRPKSPCGKARDGCRTMTLPAHLPPLNCRARGACARSAEAADPSLGKRMPGGVFEMPKKRWHRANGTSRMKRQFLLQVDAFQREGQEGQTKPAPQAAALRISRVVQPAVTVMSTCAMRSGWFSGLFP